MHRRFKLKKAFTTMLVSYIAILLIPGALAVGMSATANRLSAQRCIDDTLNNIRQGQLLLENMLETMDGNAMYLTYDYSLKWILQLGPMKDGDPNVYSIAQFHDRLNDIFSDSSIFYDYSVLLKNEYVFNDNTVSQGRDFYYQYSRHYSQMEFEDYLQRSFFTAGRSLFPLQEIKRNRNVVEALTYNYPIFSSVKTDGEADAVIQALIPKETLEGYFLPLLSQEGCQVALLDKEGVMLALLAQTEPDEQEFFEFEAAAMTEPFGSLKAKARGEGENALIIYQRSEKNNLIFAVALPESVVLKDAEALKRASFGMMFGSMLIELALGIYFAWKYSTPIRNLMHNVQMMMSVDSCSQESISDKSEYEHLESSINTILQSNQKMQTTLKEKQEKERKNFLNYLFSGEFRENEDIIREGALIGLDFRSAYYCVASYPVENPKDAILWVDKDLPQVLAIHGAGRQYLSVLFGFESEEETKKLDELTLEISSRLEKHGGQKARAGIGRLYGNEKDISFSYMQSLYSANSPKEGGVVRYTDISQDFNSLCYPTELEEKLINSTKHGEIGQIKQIFSYIRTENIENRYLSRPMGRVLASNMAATLMKVYNDIIPDEQVDQLVDQIIRKSALPEALLLLEEQFIRISEELAKSRDEREGAYQKRLAAYIEEHYRDPQLCVAMAAEEFTLSENYFSQFFKDVMEDSFSSYLESVRLGKAKELIEAGEYDLEQIAAMVGYHNSGTFRRAFKRVTGVSPSAWREQKRQKRP